MLSPRLLELLRDWWWVGRPTTWLFPGRDPLLPVTPRQLYRAVREAAEAAEIKTRVSPHTRATALPRTSWSRASTFA